MHALLFPRLLLTSSIAFFLANFAFAATLPADERKALEDIAKTLGKMDWDFNVDPCSGGSGWVTSVATEENNNSVSCSTDTIPHVVSIVLKSQNLRGTFPKELFRLPYLEEIDLTRNYLNGTIPTEWGSMQLVNISLGENRLTGSIPKEIGNISTLEKLVLEDNQLGGPLPASLGDLNSLRKLVLRGNNFTGTIPESFGKLKNLTDFRIDGSSLSGSIPDFIGNWTKLDRLDLQGTGMEGPIPSTISLLENLTELRISDLSGSSSGFPKLQTMKSMHKLVLRNCSINDTIRDYIGEMKHLKLLDLSFNRLTGGIPGRLQDIKHLDYMFLTNNSLTGEVHDWIQNSKKSFDLSYNNFTGLPTSSCKQSYVNLVSSFSTSDSNSDTWCFGKDLPCPKKAKGSSLFINCGGKTTAYEGKKYEEDLNTKGPSIFLSANSWAYSSTGFFEGSENGAVYTATSNVTDSVLYNTARLAPQSLKYYGLCLRRGNYNVTLYFAEIMFSNDQSFGSLGRRIFDISIQGKVVLEDFNIMEEAGGAGRGITREFNVDVNGSTLEIHLYWRGKGTNAIPTKGVYGPLISAIKVTPNFDVDKGLSAGAIAGIVVCSCLVVFLFLVVLRMKGYLGGRDPEDNDLKGLNLQTDSFSLRQIKAATKNFDPANKIGEGGFGPVYKGHLTDGKVIAVKQLSAKSKQGNREFVNEIGMISALQHPHLVKLYGCCIEGNQLLLIYEYMENNSLARALFGPEECQLKLDWPTRRRICIGIARGLAYLHEESRLKIVHRDIKATNVLLDKDLNPKISDFGLAKLDEEDNTHISTRIAGTYGYMAPEYAMRGYLTLKADVYSFGIVVLEIVSGRSNTVYRIKENNCYLIDWVLLLKEKGSLLELVDPKLGSDYNKKEVMETINVALLCTNSAPTARPIMSSVVGMLEGKAAVDELCLDPGTSVEPTSKFYHTLDEESTHENKTQRMTIATLPYASSSSSAADLYPVNLSSSYWQNRD